jgi:hypothetical protein
MARASSCGFSNIGGVYRQSVTTIVCIAHASDPNPVFELTCPWPMIFFSRHIVII